MTKKEKKKSIYEEDWCKDLIKRLGKYKQIEARLEIIETTLNKAIGPKNKLVATYAPSPGKISELETEHFALNNEKKDIDSALKALEKIDSDIIKLSYIEKVNKWHITDLYIPEHYKDSKGRPLYMAERTLGYKKANALRIMAKVLGYFSIL